MRSCPLFFLLFSLLLFTSSDSLHSQIDSIVRELDSVIISAGRIQTPYLSVPSSVSYLDLSSRTSFLNHADLSEAISDVPGIFTLNGQNFAQDLRISMRGFGSRAAFGIRGIKLIVDGIPETTPDGQGQLDNIAVGDISSIEILQGTSAAQYGNASGGVIEIKTLNFLEKQSLHFNFRTGSFGLQQYQVKTAQDLGLFQLQFAGTHQRSEGYRMHSRVRQSNFLLKLGRQWENTTIDWQFSFLDSPMAEDPGGINLSDALANPRIARDRNISFNAGEEITHWKTSSSLEHTFRPGVKWTNNLFYASRNFDGRLPFENGGAIDLNRSYGGILSQVQLKQIGDKWVHENRIGMDLMLQSDDRDRFLNKDGVRGVLTLSQEERFDNFGIYVIDQWSSDRWTFRGSMRYDFHYLGVTDFFESDGDQSGEKKLSAFNYSIGMTYQWHEGLSLFGNWSTSYETPALSELTANPLGGGGFNPDVLPMKAKTFEIGSKGIINDVFNYSFAAFIIHTTDELIPYELNDFPGRTFFRNAGETNRMGIESKLRFRLIPGVHVSTTYTFSDFTFGEYMIEGEDLSDLMLPGIPAHSWTNVLSIGEKTVFFRLSSQYFSAISVRDDQTVRVEPYHLVNLRLGGTLKKGGWKVQPYIAINNILSTEYFDNLRINAFGGRYYEPGASINWQIGCGVEF